MATMSGVIFANECEFTISFGAVEVAAIALGLIGHSLICTALYLDGPFPSSTIYRF